MSPGVGMHAKRSVYIMSARENADVYWKRHVQRMLCDQVSCMLHDILNSLFHVFSFSFFLCSSLTDFLFLVVVGIVTLVGVLGKTNIMPCTALWSLSLISLAARTGVLQQLLCACCESIFHVVARYARVPGEFRWSSPPPPPPPDVQSVHIWHKVNCCVSAEVCDCVGSLRLSGVEHWLSDWSALLFMF